jgi:hypothetical protein
MPNPFDLFTKKEKKEEKGKKQEREEREEKEGMTTIIEGNANRKEFGAITSAPLPGQPEKNMELIAVLIGVFFILSLLLGMMYYFNSIFVLLDSFMEPIFGKNKDNFYSEGEFNKTYGGKLTSQFFFIFIILWMIVFCLNILIFQVVLNINDYGMMFYMTTVYFFSVVGGTMVVINNVPTLVEVFENTLGVSILPMISNMKKVMEMFKNRGFETETPQFKELGISMNLNFLLTTFTMSNFHDHFDKLFNANPRSDVPAQQNDTTFYIDVSMFDEKNLLEKPYLKNPKSDIANRARYNLLRLVLQKYTIGHFVWIFLASYVSILLAVNTMPYA